MKIKTIVILLATLTIGGIIGSLGTGYFVRKKMKNVQRRFRNPDRFKGHLIERLNVSEEQEVIVSPIIEAYFKKRNDWRKKHFQQLLAMEKAFHKEIEQYLDDDQMAFLRKRLDRMKRRSLRKRRRQRSKRKRFRPD